MSNHEIEVHEIPVISTSHLTEEVAKLLTELKGQNPWTPCATWEYGYFLFLDRPEESDEDVPQCLLDIRNWLKAKGFESCWVRLDGSADIQPDLPAYEWV